MKLLIFRIEDIITARNMVRYANKVSYDAVSLNTEVNFVKNEKLNDDVNMAIPGAF